MHIESTSAKTDRPARNNWEGSQPADAEPISRGLDMQSCDIREKILGLVISAWQREDSADSVTDQIMTVIAERSAGYTAVDMTTAAADGFRDGQASVVRHDPAQYTYTG
jgi:hypothetical protein